MNLIQSANSCGYNTVVVDPDKDAPGKKIANIFYKLEPRDFNGHCEIIERHKVKGIVTSQMDKPLQFMAKIATKYNFNFLSEKSADWARNKFEMKKKFLQNNVPCANGVLLSNKSTDIEKSILALHSPLIMKPVDAYSSKGVFTISSLADILDNFETTASFSSDGTVIIEEYISGKMISVEGYVFHGHIEIIQYTERFKFTPKPMRVELGHIQPAYLTEFELEKVNKNLIQGIKALELNNCGFHAELKINEKNAFLIEIGARLGGDFNASHLVPLSTGINIEKIIANIAMGDVPEIPLRQNQYSMIKWIELNEGSKIKKLPGLNNIAANLSGISEINFLLKPDMTVPKVTDSAKRAGYIIVTGKSRDDVIQKALTIENLIQKQIEYYN